MPATPFTKAALEAAKQTLDVASENYNGASIKNMKVGQDVINLKKKLDSANVVVVKAQQALIKAQMEVSRLMSELDFADKELREAQSEFSRTGAIWSAANRAHQQAEKAYEAS